jgi:hypothetical protein
MLEHEDLLQQYGQELFWGSWAVLRSARRKGVPWRDLRELGKRLEEIAQRGPINVRSLSFARMIRLFGIRWAEVIRNICSRNRTGQETLATT